MSTNATRARMAANSTVSTITAASAVAVWPALSWLKMERPVQVSSRLCVYAIHVCMHVGVCVQMYMHTAALLACLS